MVQLHQRRPISWLEQMGRAVGADGAVYGAREQNDSIDAAQAVGMVGNYFILALPDSYHRAIWFEPLARRARRLG